MPYLTGSCKRGKQKYVALGGPSIAACLLKITCNFQEAVTGTVRASWPNEGTSNESGSKSPGFPSNSFSSPQTDATFLPILQTVCYFCPHSVPRINSASSSTRTLCGADDSFSLALLYPPRCLSSLRSSWSSASVESSWYPFPLPSPRDVPTATAHVLALLHTPGSLNRTGASFPPTLTCAAILTLCSTRSLHAAVPHSRSAPP